MKKLLFGAAVALLLVPAAPAQAEIINARAILGGGEEAPTQVLTGAVGVADLTIDTSARTIGVQIKMFNIPTATTAGHIHVGPKGVAGPVVVDFPIPPGRTGDLQLSFTVTEANLRPNAGLGINSLDDVIQAIAGGGAYVNIHTSAFPAGEIRGQLQPN
jgi:hypothetical protein